MRFTRYTPLAMFICTMLLAPAPAPAAANKDMEELQRDMADLQQQVKDLQKALLDPNDGAIMALRAQIQLTFETANKTNSSVNSLNTGVMQTLQNALKGVNEQLSSVTGLAQTVKSVSDDVGELQRSNRDMQAQLNKQGEAINDILNRVKLLQAPAAAPPPDAASAGLGASAPPPMPQSLFTNAATDQDGGKPELAMTEFKEFLHRYPSDPNAIRAQYNIGNIYYNMPGKLDDAIAAFDATIEQYSQDERTTPSAYFMKGMALKKQKKNAAAIASFKAVLQFPRSEEAPQAKQQLTSMGVATTAAKKAGH